MLNKRITKSLRNKIIAGVLVFVTLLGGGIGYKHQRDQINNLKYQLELKQDKDNQDKGYYISILLVNVRYKLLYHILLFFLYN